MDDKTLQKYPPISNESRINPERVGSMWKGAIITLLVMWPVLEPALANVTPKSYNKLIHFVIRDQNVVRAVLKKL